MCLFRCLFRHLIIPNLRWFQAACWDAYVETGSIENPSAYANCRGNICGKRVMVRLLLLDHAEKSFAGDCGNPFSLRLVINIVTRSADRYSRDFLAAVSIKHHHEWRPPRDNEHPMILFFQPNGK